MKLGDYEILGEIGRGGMGVVLRGLSSGGRDVAIKVLRGTSQELVDRFARERRLQAELGEASGFVPLLEAGVAREGPYLVLPFLAGGSLRDRLKRGPFAVGDAVALVIALARALGRAHEKGIVHRDLKPENVLFAADGAAFVSDLGLAKHFRDDVQGASQSVALTDDGDSIGTLGYMAPEQSGQVRDARPPADVFALGVILYECLAGKRPFSGKSAHRVMAKIASGEVPRLRDARPETPAWLEAVIEKAISLEPERRHANGDELARALESGPLPRKQRLFDLLTLASAIALVVFGGVLAVAGWATSRAAEKARQNEVVLDRPDDARPVTGPTRGTTPPVVSGRTAWFDALPADKRPAWPLPRGLRLGKSPNEYVNEKDGSVLVYVPATECELAAYNEVPPTGPVNLRVRLSPYFIGVHEVTHAQWEAFVRATGWVTVAEKLGSGSSGTGWDSDAALTVGLTWRLPDGTGKRPEPRHPVTQVAWPDARAYCKWAGFRLPTDAEWERAALWDVATHKRGKWVWGDEEPTAPLANFFDASAPAEWRATEPFSPWNDGFSRVAPIGSFPRDRSPCGCIDMAANVREWCEDAYDEDDSKRCPTPRDPIVRTDDSLARRVVRGSSFSAPRGGRGSGTTRNGIVPVFRRDDIGFRVVRDGF